MADYADRPSLRAALTGIDTVFMVSGAEEPDRVPAHRTFVDAAVAAGVHRIVYTSFLGASPDATFTLARDHWYTEQHIRASGSGFTFLRDNFYADQFLLFAGAGRRPAGPGRRRPGVGGGPPGCRRRRRGGAAAPPASGRRPGTTAGPTT